MTQKEITRLRVINQTIDKVITIREAAELLGLSERQVIRLKGGIEKYGPAFIIHKNRGRKPQHSISDELKRKIVELKQSKYQKANFSHFVELLDEIEDIKISYSSVHRILTQAGIKSPKKHHKSKSHHRRKRKPQKGMLVQIDASPHEWFFGKTSCSLHGAIDDVPVRFSLFSLLLMSAWKVILKSLDRLFLIMVFL
ncbi:MAG: helix-turn-helix domain-containing protein [Tepidanaerobacteraceae bacterium]